METPDGDGEDTEDGGVQGTFYNNKKSSAPKFTKKMQSVFVKPAGNMVRLKCPAEGILLHTYPLVYSYVKKMIILCYQVTLFQI